MEILICMLFRSVQSIYESLHEHFVRNSQGIVDLYGPFSDSSLRNVHVAIFRLIQRIRNIKTIMHQSSLILFFKFAVPFPEDMPANIDNQDVNPAAKGATHQLAVDLRTYGENQKTDPNEAATTDFEKTLEDLKKQREVLDNPEVIALNEQALQEGEALWQESGGNGVDSNKANAALTELNEQIKANNNQ